VKQPLIIPINVALVIVRDEISFTSIFLQESLPEKKKKKKKKKKNKSESGQNHFSKSFVYVVSFHLQTE